MKKEEQKTRNPETFPGSRGTIDIVNEKDKGLVGIVRDGLAMQLATATCFLGANHAYVEGLKRNVANAERATAVTIALFDEIVSEHGSVLGISSGQKSDALRRLITFDQRIAHIDNAASIALRMQPGNEAEERVTIACDLINTPGENVTFSISRETASFDLGLGNGSVRGYKDPEVPFIYVLAQDMDKDEVHIDEIAEVIRQLYKGEAVDAVGDRKPIHLTDLTRITLDHVGAIVLSRSINHWSADTLRSAGEKGVIVASIKNAPWISGWPRGGFNEVLAGDLEHEVGGHIADFRRADGMPISHGLFELRGFLRQMNFFRQRGSTYLEEYFHNALTPYLEVVRGENKTDGMTHIERNFRAILLEQLDKIPEEQRYRLTNVLDGLLQIS